MHRTIYLNLVPSNTVTRNTLKFNKTLEYKV